MATTTTRRRSQAVAPPHVQLARGHPTVVFGDHGFCADESMVVYRMPGPHIHSQIEINFVLEGTMTYWMDGQVLSASAGQLVMFWGMFPHQVTDIRDNPRFVCLYVPMSVFHGLFGRDRLHEAMLRGAVVKALSVKPYDRDIFINWRNELLSGDAGAEQIVRDELTARIRRIGRDGWIDLRSTATLWPVAAFQDAERMVAVERMSKFISDKGSENVSAEDVARASGLHPNYAMSIYKRAVGMSLKQSLTRHRLNIARSMLIATDFPVTRIVFDCGFGSLSSFYAAFERYFKMSPMALRKSLAEAA